MPIRRAAEARDQRNARVGAAPRISSSVHPLLALQRTAGNRAVTAMLMRHEVEGPWGIKDPVHEVLTLRAIRDALSAIEREGRNRGALLRGVDATRLPSLDSKRAHNLRPEKDIHRSAQQFIRGVVWPDDPQGFLFSDDDKLDYSTGLKWLEEFDEDEKDEPEDLIARSHYGDLQFFHGMASKEGERPGITKAKIKRWARFLSDVATGRIDPNDKVESHSTPRDLFPAHRDITLKELFAYRKATDVEARQRAAGALMHLIQDAHAKGHVDRDPVTGKVREFHAYGRQDHDKHGRYDKWAKGKDLGERIRNTVGAERAIEKCMRVLVMLDQGAPTRAVIEFLDREVLALDRNSRRAGPGTEFEKK